MTEETRDNFLSLNSRLDKRYFKALMGIDENTISDISYIESIRVKVRKFSRYLGILGKEPQIKARINHLGCLREYLRDVYKAGKAKSEYIRHVRRVLEVLVESFGESLLQDIQSLSICAKWRQFASNSLLF